MSESVCRCPCADESAEILDEDRCCPPYLFTSILLGALACVLMTGGVFLAFHRWDPMWLIVSGIGIVLVLIGSALHCCGKSTNRNTRSERKGCCGRHAHHMVAGAGSLSEQLLPPLTNARSVSQLSLNMLPGYFPPVVTTYGLEQHSAMVQNINQIIQQHNGPASNTNCPASGNGKLVLLQLPMDTNTTNMQSMVAAVYQLDGHAATEMTAENIVPVQLLNNPATAIPVMKHAEVQTCNAWPTIPHMQINQIQSTSSTAIDSLNSSNDRSEVVVATSTGATQTEDPTERLVDNSNCDIPRTNVETDNSNSDNSNPPNEIASTDTDTVPSSQATSSTSDGDISTNQHQDNGDLPPDCEIAITLELPSEIEPTVSASNAIPQVLISNTASTSTESTTNDLSGHSTETSISTSDDVVINIPVEQNIVVDSAIAGRQCNIDDAESNNLEIDIDDALSNCSNLSERDELPPSYEDVALGNDTAVGAYGIGYGTI